GGEAVLAADEPGDHRGGFIDLQETAARNANEHVVDEFLGQRVEDLRVGGGGRDGVHRDIVFGELLAERFGEADHARLGGGVGGEVRVAFLAGDRRDVDDAAVVPRLHRRDDDLVDVKGAVEVDL